MAAFNRPTEATYEVHENITVDTSDNEDHTFCGIMFPVKCKDLLPLDHLVIKSVAVRGRLGPLTVWVSNEDLRQRPGERNSERRVRLTPSFWTKLYEKTHAPSFHRYKELVLDQPIRLRPGEMRVIYVHSTLSGDEAIVYDNSSYGMSAKRYEDDKLAIMTGRAHVSSDVFGQEPIWGWGNAWRDRREFVGRLEYGTVYKLWHPQYQPKFGNNFQNGSRTLFLCQRRWESPISMLPDECIFYILNMCRWDWFDDDSDTMRERRKKEKAKAKTLAEQASAQKSASQPSAVAAGAGTTTTSPNEAAAVAVCERKCQATRMNEDHDDDAMDGAWTPGSDDGEEDDDDDDDIDIDDDVDDDEDVDSDAWSYGEDHYHRANVQSFMYHDVDSDEEEQTESDNEPAAAAATSRREWIRRQFARVHVLRALASMEDGAVAHIQF